MTSLRVHDQLRWSVACLKPGSVTSLSLVSPLAVRSDVRLPRSDGMRTTRRPGSDGSLCSTAHISQERRLILPSMGAFQIGQHFPPSGGRTSKTDDVVKR